jgi:hypothetical protein
METDRQFDIEIQRKWGRSQGLNVELGEKRSELSRIQEMIQGIRDDFTVVKAVIRFLAAPDRLTDNDFTSLRVVFADAVRWRKVMSAHLRGLGERPDDPVILAWLQHALVPYNQKLNKFRERLAFYLLPLLE